MNMSKIEFDDLKDLTELDEARTIAAQMIKFGSGFSKYLGKKLSQMDIEEIEDFKKDFPSYWNRYSKMAEVD